MAKYDEETVKLQSELWQKKAKFRALLAEPKWDEAKIKALHQDMQKLKNQLAEKRLAQMFEFKKRNPDWQPGYGQGRGKGRGLSQGGSRGWGGGPGACWR